jgi:hypothetical protein
VVLRWLRSSLRKAAYPLITRARRQKDLNRLQDRYHTPCLPLTLSCLGVIFLLGPLEPGPLRQDLTAFALFLANIRTAQPLPLSPLPHAVILQPPVHNLPANITRRLYTRLLGFEVHSALWPASNPFPAHKIPTILQHTILPRHGPYHASHDQAAAKQQHHAQDCMHEPIALTSR